LLSLPCEDTQLWSFEACAAITAITKENGIIALNSEKYVMGFPS
jgi:hypothetical protein